MLGGSSLAIVIPAYNESLTIREVINSLKNYGMPIIIDDCSTDNTSKLAKEAGATVIRHQVNKGYDEALNTGFRAAEELGYSYIITFDADGQHSAEMIPVFLKHLMEYPLVIGIRPRYARMSEYIFGLYTRWRFGLKDPLCGLKGYSMSLYQDRGWFDSYQSIGTELALYALTQKKLFTQIPIPINERIGVSRFGKSLKANYKILRAMVLSLRMHKKWR